MPENEINKVKTKLRSTCEKYFNIKVQHTQRKIISVLSKGDEIILLKKDKGQGLAVMDRSRYTEKCLEMLSIKQFTVVENKPTKTLESKIQRILRKLKSKITDLEYKLLYRKGSQPGKFYGTAKMHKLPPPFNGNLNHLLLRPIVSNINTSTYILVKFCQNYYHHYAKQIIMLEVLRTLFKILKGRIYQLATRWYLSV